MSKSCTGLFFDKIKEKPMNIIIEDGETAKVRMFNDKVRDMKSAHHSNAKSGKKSEFFVTKPQCMNDIFKAEDDLAKIKVPSDRRSELIDDLNSLFEHSHKSSKKSQPDEMAVENHKMRHELKKARDMIDTGIDQVRQLKRMVSETK